MALSEEDIKGCLHEPDLATKDFIMQQTMLRVKDPKVSLDFYTRVLGMRLLGKFDFPDMKFTLYFVGYEKEEDIPQGKDERIKWCFSRKGTVELTHNWGTENDPNFSYHNGNSEPKGFGHIGIEVPDVEKSCERFEKLQVKFIKKPNDGENVIFMDFFAVKVTGYDIKGGIFEARNKRKLICISSFDVISGKMKGLAFIQDPDGYWIEVLNRDNLVKIVSQFS